MFRYTMCVWLLMAAPALAAERPDPVVYFPANAPDTVPVAVWLHGYRAYPALLDPRVATSKKYFQGIADRLQVAIIGILGTTVLEDGTCAWSEVPATDHAYIQDILTRLNSHSRLDLKRVALFGFSQGAMVAGDIAACYPSAYRGAILMSPGGMTSPKAHTTDPDLNKRQIFFAFCGAKEAEGNVDWAKMYAQIFTKMQCQVTLKLDPNQDRHGVPADFLHSFPDWISSVLALPGKTAPPHP